MINRIKRAPRLGGWMNYFRDANTLTCALLRCYSATGNSDAMQSIYPRHDLVGVLP